MAENARKPSQITNLKNNSRNLVKKGPLSVINGEIVTRKRSNNSRKLNCKSQKQENSENDPHILNRQKTPAHVNETENFVKLKGNCLSHIQEESKNVLDNQSNTLLKQDSHFTKKIFLSANDTLPVNVESSETSSEKSSETSEKSSETSEKSSETSTLSTECNEIYAIKKDSKSKKINERLNSGDVWCTPYRHDIYNYFKNTEKQFRPNPNYMKKQSDITMNMRSVLVDWFVEVGEEYKLHPETLHLGVSYVDRFLSHMSVLRGKLQLVGTASMFLASKYEEIYPPEVSDFVYITNDTYTKKQVLRMEHLILKVLNFNISAPTAYTFLQLYCSMCNASEVVIHLSQYLCELSLLDGNLFLEFVPSIIAAGSLALANYILGFYMWGHEMSTSTGYLLTDLMHVMICLFNKYSSMSSCSHQAIYEKYKSQKYNAVASIPQPDTLDFTRKFK